MVGQTQSKRIPRYRRLDWRVSLFALLGITMIVSLLLVAAQPVLSQSTGGLVHTTDHISEPRLDIAAAAAGSQVLFAGGWGAGGPAVPLGTVDIYDDATNTWSTASLSEPRYHMGAAATESKVLFGGGFGPGGRSAVVDIYDVQTGTWSTASLSQARGQLAAAAADGKVLFGGGQLGDVVATVSAVVDIYDEQTATWTTSTLSQPRAQVSAAAAGTTIVFAGGYGVNGTGDVSSVVDIYDTTTGSWSTATLSVPHRNVATAVVGTKIFFAGGAGVGGGVPSDVVDIYDTATGSWSTAQLSVARWSLKGAAVGDKALFAGGVTGGHTNTALSDVVDVYDTTTDTWTTTTLAQPRDRMGAASVGGKAFFSGGNAAIPVVATTLTDIFSLNATPSADAGGPYAVSEGGVVTLSGAGSDSDGDSLSYAWDLDNDGTFETPGQSVSFSAAGRDGPDNQIVALEVCDSAGACATDSTAVQIDNADPIVDPITAPLDPVQLGTTILVSADFTDPGIPDAHTASIGWGDGSQCDTAVDTDCEVVEAGGSGTVNGSHTYAEPGVYTLTVNVMDDDGGSDTETFQYVVVYNPEGGFVTGGGWIDSPAGAYAGDIALTGKAHFGFVSKYQQGASAPTGNTQFRFKAGELDFESTGYQWLVVAGKKAMFKGIGTTEGEGSFGFLVSAIDGDLQGGDGIDKFRIKIWDKDNGDAVVYDNQLGADEHIDPTTAIGAGSIKIHQ